MDIDRRGIITKGTEMVESLSKNIQKTNLSSWINIIIFFGDMMP